MNILLHKMSEEEFKYYSQFSFKNFVEDTARSSGKSIEEIKGKMGKAPNKMGDDDLWYVVKCNEESIGFFWIKVDQEKKEAFGYDIYLNEDYRGKGIGREVMIKGKELLQNNGMRKVGICVFGENKVARKLYDSFGFEEAGYNKNRNQYQLEITL